MSTILTQTRPFNLDTTNAIPNGDVGYTKPVGLVYVTFFARSGEHEIFVFNDNQWVLHETLLQGEFKNIKMENINQFYVRCKVASGVMRISPKIDKSANTAIKQDLKYGKALTEAGNISQQRPSNTDILKANGSDLSFDSNPSVSVQYSTTSVFPSINSVSLETIDSDVYLVTVNGENLTKDTQLYIYDSQIDDSVAQSLSAGYLDENDSNIGEVVDLVAYSIYPEKPEASSFGSLEFIPEEGVVCVNTNQTFGNKNPISFVSSYEMKIAMKGVLGVNSYSVFAKDDNGSFLHKGSFTLDISNETEEISPEGTFTAYDNAVIDGDTFTLDGDGDYVTYNEEFRYSDQFTISTWFKADPNMTDPYIIFSNHDAGGVGPNGNFATLNPNGTLNVKTMDSGTGTSGDALNIGSNLADGNWHQLTVAWEASTTNGRKIYVDGQLIHQNNSGTPNAWKTTPQSLLYIGSMWNGVTSQFATSNWFKGQIANFSIVNSITTAQEVADDYANNDPSPFVPVEVTAPDLYFDGSSTDAQIGNNSVTFVGTSGLATASGKYDTASFEFGTTGNNYLGFDNPISLSGTYTFSLWFFNKKAHSGYGAILKSAGTGLDNSRYAMIAHQTNEELGVFDVVNGSTQFFGSGYNMTSLEGLQDWTHLVVVADGTNSTFYINGQQVGSQVARVITTNVGVMNSYSLQNQVFAQYIDEFAYWDSALTADQVETIYNSSEKLSVLAPSLTAYNDAIIEGDTITLDGDGDYAIYNGEFRYSDQFTISTWFKSNGNMANLDTIFSNHDGGGVANGNTVTLNPDGTLRVKTLDSGTGTNGDALNIGSNLADGNWHQLVLTWQANTTNGRKVYVDGQLIHQNNSGTPNAWRTDAGSKTYIGALWLYTTDQLLPDNFFNGQIKNFNIVNSITTAQEVVDDYTNNHPTADGLEDVAVMQNGATLVDGELVLNGVDQYATLADADAYDRLAGEDVTMHMWVYANSFSDNNRMTLMRKGVAGPSDWDGYIIELRDTSHDNIATGDMGIKIFSTDYNGGVEPNNTIFRPAGGISLNEWHHIAVTMKDSSDEIEVYFDGQSLGTWTAVQGLSHGNGYDLTLGGDGVSGRSLDGKMKKVTIEKSILTAEQIAALYVADAPTVEVTTPNVYFDGSSTTAQIGNQTLTLQSGVSIGTGNGKYDTSFINYGASGMTNTALLNDGIDLSTGVYTFSLWFYNKRNGDDIELVLRQHVDLANPPASTNYPIVIRPTAIGGGATVAQELGVYKRIGSTNTFYGTGFSMSDYAGLSEWTHLAVVADGATSKFYINGQKVGNDVAAVINIVVRQLGSYSRGYQTFAEGIDEFAYWDSALSAAQVATIYNSSEKLDVFTVAPAQESSNSLPIPDLYLDGSSATPQIGNPSDVVNLGSATLVTNNGRYDSKSFNFGTSGNKAPIRLSNLDLSTGIYSVSLWFYNKRGGNDFGSILRQSGTGSNSAYYPAGTHQTTNELGLHLGAPSTASSDYGFRSTGYDMTSFEGLQEWSHLVVVADGTNTTFYINGQQAGNVVPHVVATHLREVGAYDGNDTQVFAQALDDFAYWGSALTADHVAEIYNSSVKLGGLVTEAPASQDLEESGNATYVADAVVTNGILDLDGTGDYLSIPHDIAYDRESGDMSVMLWFKPRAIGYLSTLISKGTGNPSWDGWIVAVTEDDLSATDLNGNSMANGGFRFFNSAGSTNDIKYLAPTGGISLNQWHHMTLVMKAAGAYEFYYDGNLLGTFTPSSKSTTTNTELLMGANKDGGSQPAYNRMFNGMIDGVTIVKEALTSDQIAAAYNVGLNSGTYDAVISELASVVNAQSNGTLNQGATVVNDMYLDPNTRGQGFVQGTWTNDMRPDNSADDFSFSGYWRIKTANDNDRGWLFGRDGSVSDGGWGIFLKKRSATTVAYEIVMAGGNPTFITDDITTNVYDEFHHVSFTYSNGEWKFYHDGVLVYTKTGVNMPTTNPPGGKYKLGNGWAVLALDEINLFKGTYLSTSQITSLAGERSQKDTDYTNNT